MDNLYQFENWNEFKDLYWLDKIILKAIFPFFLIDNRKIEKGNEELANELNISLSQVRGSLSRLRKSEFIISVPLTYIKNDKYF